MYYEQDYLVVQRFVLEINLAKLMLNRSVPWRKDDIRTEFKLTKMTMQILMKE